VKRRGQTKIATSESARQKQYENYTTRILVGKDSGLIRGI
jgi:hypothetical protein